MNGEKQESTLLGTRIIDLEMYKNRLSEICNVRLVNFNFDAQIYFVNSAKLDSVELTFFQTNKIEK